MKVVTHPSHMHEIKHDCTLHVFIKYSMGMRDIKKIRANKHNCAPLLIPLRIGIDI
jgi:hypothetical protein